MKNPSCFLAALTLAVLGGCAVPGDRAQTGCPQDEVCSPDTPNGLYFYGARFGDDWFSGGPEATAAGGRQTIEVVRDDSGTDFNLPFDAAGTDQISVVAVIPPDVAVRAGAAGSGLLRILDPDDGSLYDRIQLQVATVARTELAPIALTFWLAPPELPWAAFRGGQVPVVVRLYSAGDGRLVDEDLELTTTATSNQTGWDSYVVSATADTLSGAILSGGASHPFPDIPVVDAIDDIQYAGQDDTLPAITAGSPHSLCFWGANAGRIVAGAPWSFSTPDALELAPSALDDACVDVTPLAAGPYTLTVEAAAFTKSYTVTATPATMAAPAPTAPRSGTAWRAPRDARGERAR